LKRKSFCEIRAKDCSEKPDPKGKPQKINNTKKYMEVKDSNGNILAEGDSVTVIKDLKLRVLRELLKEALWLKK
jgi:uncharacterized Zn ribbon protein